MEIVLFFSQKETTTKYGLQVMRLYIELLHITDVHLSVSSQWTGIVC